MKRCSFKTLIKMMAREHDVELLQSYKLEMKNVIVCSPKAHCRAYSLH